MDELRENHKFTDAHIAQPRNFYHFASGLIPGVYYDAFFARDGQVVASVLIDVKDHEENRRIFNQLKQDQTKIGAEFGAQLEWSNDDRVQACSIRARRSGSIDDDAATLGEVHAWLIKHLLKLKKVFGERLQAASYRN